MADVSRETDRSAPGDPAPGVAEHAPAAPAVVGSLFGERAADASRYVALLRGPGVERGLIGPREAPRLWSRHILNCAVVARAFAPGAAVCDVGSGAGLPGIVLAMARPDLQVTLLEPLLRRTTFLAEIVADLRLDNVTVRRGRAEELRGTLWFDAATARAVASLSVLVGWALPLVRAGGELIALKGDTVRAELDAAQVSIHRWGGRDATIETYGVGMVEPATTVVRIGSSRTHPRKRKGRGDVVPGPGGERSRLADDRGHSQEFHTD